MEKLFSALAFGNDLNCNRLPCLLLTYHSHSQTSSLTSLILELTTWSLTPPSSLSLTPWLLLINQLFSHYFLPANLTFTLVTQTLDLQNSDPTCLPPSLDPMVGYPTNALLSIFNFLSFLLSGLLAILGPTCYGLNCVCTKKVCWGPKPQYLRILSWK